MVHARLGIAEENSGKLVTLVRKEAQKIAEEKGLDLLLIDGSPGIGCPVIASVTGAHLAIVVTEPTVSGIHDLKRVATLTRQFNIPTFVCINKWDLNPDMSEEIEKQSSGMGLRNAGRIRYDSSVTKSQIERKAVVEYQADGVPDDIRNVWEKIRSVL